MKLHVINHHFWPDGSPSAILEEELADTLRGKGYDVVFVCGSGSFHDSTRPKPQSPIVRLASSETGRRGSQGSILMDYARFSRAIRAYAMSEIHPGDGVLATSSPFTNSLLARIIRKAAPGARLVFHLHDYLPSNLASLSPLHRIAAPIVKAILDSSLKRWDAVVVCAANIAYHEANRVVARFWPTIARTPGRRVDSSARTVLYAGNLGIAHDIDALVREMTALHKQGYQIDFYADGPGTKALPTWVNLRGFASGQDYLDVLYTHPIHLVAGVKNNGTGAFPSKTLNSLYVGATVHPCGFQPEMRQELEALRSCPDLGANREIAADVIDHILRGGTPQSLSEPASNL